MPSSRIARIKHKEKMRKGGFSFFLGLDPREFSQPCKGPGGSQSAVPLLIYAFGSIQCLRGQVSNLTEHFRQVETLPPQTPLNHVADCRRLNHSRAEEWSPTARNWFWISC